MRDHAIQIARRLKDLRGVRATRSVEARLGEQGGQTAAEYLGIILVIAAVIGAIGASGIGAQVTSRIEATIASLATGQGGDAGREGARDEESRGVNGGRDGSGNGDAGRSSPAKPPSGAAGARGPGSESGEPDSSAASFPAFDSDGVPLPSPPPPPDAGAGEFDSRGAGARERITEAKWKAAAEYAEVRGWTDAARHLRHYLGGSGETLAVEPERIVRDEPAFERAVKEDARALVLDAQLRAFQDAQPGRRFAVRTDWANTTAEGENWFRGLGTFSRHLTGTGTVLPPSTPGGRPRVRIDYKVHVADRYNWDDGKKTNIFGDEPTPDEELGSLHETGLAQEYDVRGSSRTVSVVVDVPEDPLPAPPDPGNPPPPQGTGREGRSGQRSDPGRDQGR